MPKKTIFLSYAHADEEDADQIDECLQNLGYDVKRDVRDVKHWGALRAFMQSIRKEDYVVLLVSDTYLRRDNCMYEVMQLLKDESYQQRAFPVVIDFSKEEKEKRSKADKAQSMFGKNGKMYLEKKLRRFKWNIDMRLLKNTANSAISHRALVSS